MACLIPGARFTLIVSAGHFLQEEKGPEIAEQTLRLCLTDIRSIEVYEGKSKRY
jgi:hypothetical protein